jgi:hypothetical protein
MNITDEQIVSIIEALSKISTDVDGPEFGLPIGYEPQMSQAIRSILNTPDNVQTSTNDKAIEVLQRIANAFPEFDMDETEEDTDINGGDAVDFLGEIWPDLKEALATQPKPDNVRILSKPELLYKLTGTETPKFITERENCMIDKFLTLFNEK